jgi:non-canonical (house-cleaning) NTP pyrophosphatase
MSSQQPLGPIDGSIPKSSLAGLLSAGRGGIEVAVDSSDPEKLLGVRDGLVRFFEDGLHRPLPVRVSSAGSDGDGAAILLADEEMIERAMERARRLRLASPGAAFVASSETGIHSLRVGERDVHFVRSWVVVCAADRQASEAVGGSGSLQLPTRLIVGLEVGDLPFAVPGRRRRGGMVSSLTGGLETRRRCLALATLNAISTLFFGVIETQPSR